MTTFIPSHADVGYLVGVPVRETLRTEGNIEAALNSAYAIDSRMYFQSKIKEYETDFLTIVITSTTNELIVYARRSRAISGRPWGSWFNRRL